MIFEQIYSALSVHINEMMAVSAAHCCGELSALLWYREIQGMKWWNQREGNDTIGFEVCFKKSKYLEKDSILIWKGREGRNTLCRQATLIKVY